MGRNGKPVVKRIFFAGTLLAVLLVAEFTFPDGIFGVYGPKQSFRRASLRRIVAQETRRYLAENEKAFREFEKKFSQAGEEEFLLAKKNVPGAAKEFSHAGWNLKLCCKMAKDALYKTDDAGKALAEKLKPGILAPCERGNTLLRAELENFLLVLTENENRFHADLALCAGQSGRFGSRETARLRFLLECGKFAQQAQSDALDRVLTLFSAGLELLFLRSTLKMISSAFRHIVARLVLTGTSSGICAAADGPLPVGDIIGAVLGIGGGIWCACDLYRISKTLPEEMEKNLALLVENYRKESREHAWKTAKQALADHRRAAEKIAKELENLP
ncbi:MAG: hypothetical protein J6331_04960 [Lentisphaeria bacterium]|nr:hypothetical protein [Lentisphaeria bacterium]